MEISEIRPFGPTVLGQWKRKGNVAATQHIKTVFVCTSITEYPPGKQLSVMYQQRDLWKATNIRFRRSGKVGVALVGTDATVDECAEWAATQGVVETIDVSAESMQYFYDNRKRGEYGKVARNTYDIDNEDLIHQYEVLGRGLHDMAKEYNCTYHNLYNRIRRHKKRNHIDHTPKQIALDVDPIELIRLREVEAMKYKDLATLYECSQPTIRNAYIRAKARLTNKV
jgi:predicted DNA-binding protein (UPF0251 family)